jgi:type II restriction/modification system DNA methylase subunit YeeA
MPVNTAALKTFAPAMRRQLIEAAGRKLDLLLHQASADTLTTAAGPIDELRQQEATNRQELLERVAYSWFNRLAALRYLDARGWHPFGARVLMPQTETETQPELLKLLRSGSLPAELQPHTDEARLQGLLDGRIPTAMAGADPQGEVYRELILAVCRSYHQLLPNLFEGLDDASELLLPDDLLSDGSIAGGFRSQISDSDCEDVEIIGWLYQFYISEKKDQVIGKVVKSEDIPAATQLFTPNWIVKYMVQNSLGAQWLATYPDSALKGQMEYYIEPAEQTDEVKAQLAAITPESLNPEELTLIDPACGSGHILVEAYELFKAIYLERGYQQREIPQLILQKNLFGLDIDQRAAQLTSFALMMKGRADDRRLFERGVRLNVMALVDSDGLDVEALANAVNLGDHGLKLADLVELKQLFEHATTFGSLIQVPDGLAEKLPTLRRLSELKGQDMLVAEALKCLEPLVRQAEMLAMKYDTVVVNPPYMGSGGMNGALKAFTKDKYYNARGDLFACFMERSYELASEAGFIAMVTMQSWMFLSSFEGLRVKTLQSKAVRTITQIGYNSFPSMNSKIAQAVTFSLVNRPIKNYISTFVDLNTAPQSANKQEVYLARNPDNQFSLSAEKFNKIPGSPIAFRVGEELRSQFEKNSAFDQFAKPLIGMRTGDNDRFLRYWFEIDNGKANFSANDADEAVNSGMKWFPYQKGGAFRKWSGNLEYVVNWLDNGLEIKTETLKKYPQLSIDKLGWKISNELHYFRKSLTWTATSSSSFCSRLSRAGCLFDVKGSFAVPSKQYLLSCLGFLCSPVAQYLLKCINPTIETQPRDISILPYYNQSIEARLPDFDQLCNELVWIGTTDWDAYERSWDFQSLPLLSASTDPNPTLESSYTAWIANNKQTIAEMKHLEEENNRLFIDAYGLQDELSPEVPIEQITLTVNPAYRYGGNLSGDELWSRLRQDTIKEFLSYATGCMMGRYSLDHPGLILANAGDTLENYYAKVGICSDAVAFQPDRDGIIPVLDGEWFEDDIVARSREFLRVCFPASSLNTDLAFIETSLGKDLRKYFCSDFYKDHLQTYKKRPIYWLVQSPAGPAKGGFACLIYLHRYTKDTLNLVLNHYFRPYLQKLEARQAQLGLDQLNDALPSRDRTAARKEAEKITKVLKDCQAWEQDSLLPLAQQRIELDLDDGVKVNYLKLQDVLAPIPGLAAKED